MARQDEREENSASRARVALQNTKIPKSEVHIFTDGEIMC